MEVILLERVGRLGTVGDVVNVKNGYGRNFLLPQKKALRATAENKAVFDARRAEIEAQNAAARAAAEKAGKAMGNLSVKIVRQASEDGKLYGSVVLRDIADALVEQGHKVERKQLELNSTIKTTGAYSAKLSLHPEVVLNVVVNVVRNESDVIEEAPADLVAAEEDSSAA